MKTAKTIIEFINYIINLVILGIIFCLIIDLITYNSVLQIISAILIGVKILAYFSNEIINSLCE